MHHYIQIKPSDLAFSTLFLYCISHEMIKLAIHYIKERRAYTEAQHIASETLGGTALTGAASLCTALALAKYRRQLLDTGRKHLLKGKCHILDALQTIIVCATCSRHPPR